MFKRAFLAAIAVLMMPALAVAQSSVTFYVGVWYPGVADEDYVSVDATVSCNAGIPLEQTATVGQFESDDAVLFTVTELFDPPTCTVSFTDGPEGFIVSQVDNNETFYSDATSCTYGPASGDGIQEVVVVENYCVLWLEPAPVDFEVTVDWQISPDADVGVGDYAYAALQCYGLGTDGNGYSATTLGAGPDDDMPLVLAGLTPDPDGSSYCYANLYGTGSAVETDNEECWGAPVDLEVGSDASCTITATAFYEGVPTLSQYGMAVMVLLMLGMGFVGFRRFV